MMKMTTKKPTIGVYSFSSCSGCQIAILNLEDVLVQLLDKLNIRYFHLIQSENNEGPVDIAFIEGAITTKEHIQKLKKIREQSQKVIAIGSCSCTGGIPAMKNLEKREDLKKLCYSLEGAEHISTIPAQGIDRYIEVDHYIRGCPITKEEFVEAVLSMLNEKRPYQRPYPVCTECRINENRCLLEEDKICLGSLSFMGCGAPCPNQGHPCIACRGPYDDARLSTFLRFAKEKGLNKKSLIEQFNKYVEERFDKTILEKELK